MINHLPRPVGINHVALEVADVDAALVFYARVFHLPAVEREGTMAFLDLGDQFLTLAERADAERHFGLVVDDKEAVRRRLVHEGIPIEPGRFLDFHDPWGNRFQIVDYRQIRFAKTPETLRAMALEELIG